MRPGDAGQVDLSPRYKWIVLAITTIGVLMVSIDSTVAILAFPDIMLELQAGLVTMVWVLMAYILASTVFLLALGRVADIYGRARLYTIGFAIFTVGSAFCGLSQSGWELIASRFLQGVGGALMLVNALAILTEAFPQNQRGMALGVNSMTFGLGSIVGPLLGGAILAIASWRWVFWINLPIGAAGTFFSYRYLRETSSRRSEETLDPVGVVTFSVSLLALLLVLTQGITLGWLSWQILTLAGVFVVTLTVFFLWERRVRCPALDLSLFRNRQYNFAVLAATFQSLAIFAVQFLVVFYLQMVRGNSPLRAAILLLPLPVALAVTGPLSGRLSDRIGPRVPTTVGLLIQTTGVIILSTITVEAPYLLIAVGLALTGLGGGMFFSPNTSAAMSNSPRERLGVASATLATGRNVGMVTSFALALAVAAASVPAAVMLELFVGTTGPLGPALASAFVDGMRSALHLSAGICLLAAAISFVRGPREAAR